MQIRPFETRDYQSVLSWWKDQNEIAPTFDMLPQDSTFILEVNFKPVACLSVYLTNCKEIAYLENFAADPNYRNTDRDFLLRKLISHVEGFAKQMGYKRLVCLAYKNKLKNRYQEFGYKMTLDTLSSFVKEIN